MNTQFTIRRERPHKSDKYVKCYIRDEDRSGKTEKVGWSWCIYGSPQDKECSVLSNCVGYATGRFNEIYNELTGYEGMKYLYFNGNPTSFIERAQQYYKDLLIRDFPGLGDIIVWNDHVAIVEDIISKNEITITDSAYGGRVFKIYNIRNDNGNWGRSKLLGFIHNKIIRDEPIPEPSDIKVGDIVKLKPGVVQDIHGTHLRIDYLASQILQVSAINNNVANLINAMQGWLECQMYLNDLEKTGNNINTQEDEKNAPEVKSEPQEAIQDEPVIEDKKEIKIPDVQDVKESEYNMWTKEFWKDTAERVIYTMVETALGLITGCALLSEIDWMVVLSSTGIAGLITLLKCILLKLK